ncbi:MAG: hypothetical protein KC621_08380 [Myxococcales bacterium]|nr:hypothetical protein [Myxococcales bacterium]
MWWWLASCTDPTRPACDGDEAAPESVFVDVSAPLGAFRPIAGLLHGSTSEAPLPDPSLVEPLRLPAWRTSLLSEHDRYPDLADTITWVVPDDLDAALAGTPAWSDLPRTREIVHDLVTEHTTGGGSRVDLWDLGSEPNWTFDGTPEQWETTALATLDAIREVDPGARVVGPSVGPAPGDATFDVERVLDFVDLIADSGREVDALSWHEFFEPSDLVAHAEEVRAHAFARLGEVPELHVNEFGGPDTAQVPGWSVAWLSALHRAGIDRANRACWDVDGWSGCFRACPGCSSATARHPRRRRRRGTRTHPHHPRGAGGRVRHGLGHAGGCRRRGRLVARVDPVTP